MKTPSPQLITKEGQELVDTGHSSLSCKGTILRCVYMVPRGPGPGVYSGTCSPTLHVKDHLQKHYPPPGFQLQSAFWGNQTKTGLSMPTHCAHGSTPRGTLREVTMQRHTQARAHRRASDLAERRGHPQALTSSPPQTRDQNPLPAPEKSPPRSRKLMSWLTSRLTPRLTPWPISNSRPQSAMACV